MHLSVLLMKNIGMLFMAMIFGFCLVRMKLAKCEDSRILSVINTYVLVPCAILKSFQIESTTENQRDFLLLIVAAIAVHALLILFANLIRKPLRLRHIECASLIYTNAGSLVMPLVVALFGESMLFGTSAFATVQLFLIWTHGRALISGQRGHSWKQVFLNFNVAVIFLGVLLCLLRIRIPGILVDAMGQMSQMMGPVCMLTIGMLIGGTDLKSVFTDARAYVTVLIRLLVCPLLTIIFIKITGIAGFGSSPNVLILTLLASSAPSAATIINISQLHGGDTDAAVRINILSTLLCIVTMPAMLQLYQWILLP